MAKRSAHFRATTVLLCPSLGQKSQLSSPAGAGLHPSDAFCLLYVEPVQNCAWALHHYRSWCSNWLLYSHLMFLFKTKIITFFGGKKKILLLKLLLLQCYRVGFVCWWMGLRRWAPGGFCQSHRLMPRLRGLGLAAQTVSCGALSTN